MRHEIVNGRRRLIVTRGPAGLSAECDGNPKLAALFAGELAPERYDELIEQFHAWARADASKGRAKAKRAAPKPLGGLAPWFGAKRKLAPQIVELLGPHTMYVEPFCGSMAVLFAKPPCRHEIANDFNRDLANAATVIADPDRSRDLLARLHLTVASQEIHARYKTVLAEPFAGALGDVDRAYAALVVWWLGRSGCAGTKNSRTGFAARYTSGGSSVATRWRSLVAVVPKLSARLRTVDVLNTDGFTVLRQCQDKPGTAIYVDPPYVVKAGEYQHDAPKDPAVAKKWHGALAAACSRFRHARVLVSYYPHPLLDDLYDPAHWRRVDFAVRKSMTNTRKLAEERNETAVECVYVNDAARVGPPEKAP